MHPMRILLLCLVMLMGLMAPQAHAQSAEVQAMPGHITQDQPAAAPTPDGQPVERKHLMVPPKNPDGSIKVTPFFENPVMFVRDMQQNFYGAMSKSLKQMKQDGGSGQAAWWLMWVSLAYGVFHAAGPGHGKTVISGWLLATENELKRGILVAFMSAIVQAIVAIVLVSAALLLLEGASSAAKNAAGYLESTSYALIAGMGAYLLWTGLRTFMPKKVAAVSVGAAAVGHTHHFEIVNPLPAAHPHDHVHDANCDCGHAHVPLPQDVDKDWSWKRAFSLAFAVGIRPCTGALLVLLFANALGIYWAGVASTFVMALGTFATVAVIASIAVYSKKLANRIASRDDRWMQRLNIGLRLAGGAAILGLGVMLFISALSGPLTDSF